MSNLTLTPERATRFKQSVITAKKRCTEKGFSDKQIRNFILRAMRQTAAPEYHAHYRAILNELIPTKTQKRAIESRSISISPYSDMEIVNY